MIWLFREAPLLITIWKRDIVQLCQESILSNVDKRDWLMMNRHLENTFYLRRMLHVGFLLNLNMDAYQFALHAENMVQFSVTY